MTNYVSDRFQQPGNKYSLGSKFKEKISQLFYYHGLNCSRHPYLLFILSFLLFIFCCYPIFGIHLFQNDFSQQFVTDFDTFKDLNLNTSTFDENVNSINSTIGDKKLFNKAPRWFNYGKPHAYVMQIIIQSAVIPWQDNLILMDAIRAPIAQVFSIVELISNFQLKIDQQHSISLNDVCLQVSEPIMLKDEVAFSYLPRYSCLTLSPANVWKNDLNKFLKDSEIIKTIFDIKDTSSLESGSLKELLFGLSWIQTGIRKLYVRTRQRTINYAITLVFKEFNEEFIENLKRTLKDKFPGSPFKNPSVNSNSNNNNEFLNKKIVHLYFQNQPNFTEFLPLVLAYLLVFIIIYLSVRKIDLIKNKFILALGSVFTIILILLTSIGICFWLEFNPTINGSDILPYFVILLGFENVFILIKSVASTPHHLDLKVRMAQGLSKEALSLLNNFIILFMLHVLGYLTFIPIIQDVCLFGIVSLASNLVTQLTFFSPILANNIRKTSKNSNHQKGHKKNLSASKPITYTLKNSNSETNLQKQLDNQFSPTKVYARPSAIVQQTKEPKRLRFFYFIVEQRLINKLMVLIFITWVLILSFGTFRFSSSGTGSNKTKLHDDNNQNSLWNVKSFSDTDQRDKLTFEKHEFTKNKFLFSHFLSSQHWSTLFWSYNITLSGKYITILPALQLSIPVKPEKAIETRHVLESDPQIFRQYLFPKKIPFTDSIDDYEDEILYKNLEINNWSKKSIALATFILSILFFIIIYLLTSLYRCICTRQYPEWRSSWFGNKNKDKNALNGKYLEDLVMETLPIKFKAHEQEIEYLQANVNTQTVVSCDLQGDVKIWDTLSGENLTFIRRSNFKDKKNSINKNQQQNKLNGDACSLGSDSTLSSSNGDDNDLNDDISLQSANLLNSLSNNNKQQQLYQLKNHHSNNYMNNSKQNGGFNFKKYYYKANFSNNLISKFIFNATTRSNSTDKIYNNDDISSKANVNVTSELKFQSIWSVYQNDKLVFLGCSNGRFEIWHIHSGELCYFNETCDSGITQISSNNQKLVIARLSGFIEIYEQELKPNNSTDFTNCYRINEKKNGLNNSSSLNNSSFTSSTFNNLSHQTEFTNKSQNFITFKYLQTINAHKQPITCLKIDDKYMLTGSADNLIRVFKFEQLICNSVFTLHGHFGGITCLEIDRFTNTAVSGCQLGQICVWDLCSGMCLFSLEAHNGTITEIIITNLYIISSAVDNKINIWDQLTGNLVNTINYQYSLCHKMIIMASNILVTVNDDELHLWDITDEAKKIKVVKISGDEKYSLIRNLGLSFKGRVIVCDYSTYLCFVHFPGICNQKFD